MIAFFLRRFSQMFLTMAVATMIVFVVTESTPGSVARKLLGPFATPEQVSMLAERLQLNDPIPVRYVRWLGTLVGVIPDPLSDPAIGLNYENPRGHQYFGNLGYSTLYKTSVESVLWDRLLNSGLLAGAALALVIPLSIVLGVVSGMAEGRPGDRIISLVSIVTSSVPEFASAVFFIAVFVVTLKILPGTAPLDPTGQWSLAEQLLLPVVVLVLYDFGYVTRIMRGAMAQEMKKPYVRTAVLKGLPLSRVVINHAFRNALLVPFTVILLQVHFLITGVVVTEVIFAYPGFGRMLMEAALFGDIAIIEAATLVAVLIAVGTQLVGDVGYMLINPRVRLA